MNCNNNVKDFRRPVKFVRLSFVFKTDPIIGCLLFKNGQMIKVLQASNRLTTNQSDALISFEVLNEIKMNTL